MWSTSVNTWSPPPVAVDLRAASKARPSNDPLTQRRLVRSLHIMKTTSPFEEMQSHRREITIAPRTQVTLDEIRTRSSSISPYCCIIVLHQVFVVLRRHHLSVHNNNWYSPTRPIKQRLGLSTYLIQRLELCKSASKNKNLLVNGRTTPIPPQLVGGSSVELEKHGR